jgi:hypothetical protein
VHWLASRQPETAEEQAAIWLTASAKEAIGGTLMVATDH